MGRAYSDDLRERVAASILGGRPCRATGSAAARPRGRKQPRSLAAEREWLLERLATKPDVTLGGLVAELSERGVVTNCGSVWRIVREAGITFKKGR